MEKILGKTKENLFFHQNMGNYFLKDSMLEATFQDCLEHHLIPMSLMGEKKTKSSSIDEGIWHIYTVSTM